MLPASARSPSEMSKMEKLVSLARAFHLTSPEQAHGRCFASSLALASLAAERGFAVELISWRVFGDPDFCDHWAVLVDGETVLDPTHVQVDGDARLVHKPGDYPSNYRHPRRYPAGLLVPLYDALGVAQAPRFPPGFMWRATIAMAGFDMRRALRNRKFGALRPALSGIGAALIRVALTRARDYLLRDILPHHMPVR
ncbi:MAG TPA: hypothetical protein VF798_15970 [Burkholderiaceae bacterium]